MEEAKHPEEEVAELFLSAGQELAEAVGPRPGEVWRFARPHPTADALGAVG
jgi:hypothetical protein